MTDRSAADRLAPTNPFAILLIGFQNDYFADDGILHAVVESNVRKNRVLDHTMHLLDALKDTDVPFINLPILFSADYSELSNPTGLMAKIKEVGAFRRDTTGGKTIPQLAAFGDRVTNLHGKTGFNAFLGTGLDEHLQARGIKEVVLAGVVTSVCIDSTGRAASEMGYRATILSDAAAGRSEMEHSFYCSDVFPLYAQVETTEGFVARAQAQRTAA